MLVGNKLDMSAKRTVTHAEGKNLGILFITKPTNTEFNLWKLLPRQLKT